MKISRMSLQVCKVDLQETFSYLYYNSVINLSPIDNKDFNGT